MFAGVVGLRAHQTRMDVIGNNIANVNTTAFKASRVTFQDVFSQTIRGASGPAGDFGGSNPQQIGLGVGVSTIDLVNTMGSMQLTGRETDMAIEGNGFFVLRTGGAMSYSRAGSFDRDAQGFLVNPANGARVQGWTARADGTFDVKDQSTLTDVRIPVGDVILASQTEKVLFNQSLNANALLTTPEHTTAVTVYDTLGRQWTTKFKFKKVGDSTWDVGVVDPTNPAAYAAVTQAALPTPPLMGATNTYGAGTTGRVEFNNDGTLRDNDGDAKTPFTFTFTFTPTGLAAQTVTLDFTQVSQPAMAGTTDSTTSVMDRDGYPMGALDSFSVDQRGIISGVYSNGVRKQIAQVALAAFANPGGLLKSAGNTYNQSNNSGIAQIGEAGIGGRGKVAPANLEMSNVDISAEFTSMIVTQRGFQANSRIITASDEMLQDVVNLKR